MRLLLFAAFVFLFGLLRPAIADARECLAVEDRRALIASGQVVPLERAIRAAKVQSKDVIDARLCRSGKGYVYLLTILARDGKVTQATVDASSGKGAGAS